MSCLGHTVIFLIYIYIYVAQLLSLSPSGPAQLLWPSVQRKTENRGMDGERSWWGKERNRGGENGKEKGGSVEKERGPF